MYVIPFSMGPIGGSLSKIGIELTDSNYVVLCMRLMTRVSPRIWDVLGNGDFVRCIHSVGLPRPVKQKVINHWPCNPERVIENFIVGKFTFFSREKKINCKSKFLSVQIE